MRRVRLEESRLGQRAPIPIHLLAVGTLPSSMASDLLWATHVFKLLALVGVVWFTAPERQLWMGLAVAVLVLGTLLLQARWPRSCAEPLRDEALLVGGLALLGAAELGLAQAWPVVALGVGGGVLAMALGGLVIYLLWGSRPSFVEMRRRTLRILGDNPDALTAICRVWIDDKGVVLTLPHTAQGPITLAVNRPNMKVVASVPWRDLRGPLEEKGQVRVFVGSGPPPSDATDFQIELPPGRYLASVRNYRPFDRDTLPDVRRGGAA